MPVRISGEYTRLIVKNYVNDNKVTKGTKSDYRKDNEHADTVQISKEARDILLVKEGLEKTEKSREERMAEIKARIDSGKYNVSSEDIADAILKRLGRK